MKNMLSLCTDFLSRDDSARRYSSRRVLFAAFASMLLHVFFMGNYGNLLSRSISSTEGKLHVTLVTQRATAPELKATDDGEASSHPVTTHEAALEPVPRVERMPTREPNNLPKPEESPKAQSESRKDATASLQHELPPGISQAGPRGPARRVDLSFEIVSGTDGRILGSGQHHYLATDDDYFTLSASEIPLQGGGAGVPTWQMNIAGRILRKGLSPNVFELKGSVPDGLFSPRSAADSGGDRVRPLSGRMPDGLPDRQSLLYQFMHKPPDSGGGRLSLTDGSAIETYNYVVDGLETIRIPGRGDILATKLVLRSEKTKDAIELWLIPQLGYLPAKARYIGENGSIIEQNVLSLDFD